MTEKHMLDPDNKTRFTSIEEMRDIYLDELIKLHSDSNIEAIMLMQELNPETKEVTLRAMVLHEDNHVCFHESNPIPSFFVTPLENNNAS